MPFDHRPPAVFLMGPTAAGKTALACDLATRFPLDLISVDSALVYRGMDIGTAKPDAATRARHPHALVDIRAIDEPYSAAEFRTDALAAMRRAHERGRVPLLVGGTGLYFRALQKGLSPLPPAQPELRRKLADEAARQGWPTLHARLADLDPVAAARIRPGDAQRIQRALEVIEASGRRLSDLLADAAVERFPWRVLKLAWVPRAREVLHARIEQRLDAMLQEGFLHEVARLRAQCDDATLPAWRAVGYRQGRAHLRGQIDQAEFRRRALAATRQLAKRQLTWLRGELDARWLDALEDTAMARARAALAAFIGPGLPVV